MKVTILASGQIQIGSTILSPEQAIQLAKQLMEAAQTITPKMFLGEWEETI